MCAYTTNQMKNSSFENHDSFFRINEILKEHNLFEILFLQTFFTWFFSENCKKKLYIFLTI